MKYTVRKLFEMFYEDNDTDKNEFYSDNYVGGEEADYFIRLITHFSPGEKQIIRSDCHEEFLNNISIGEAEVDTDGILVLDRMGHEEDYRITRIDSIEDTEKYILGDAGITNMFTADIVVMENGKRKKFYIKDKVGKILNWKDFMQEDIGAMDEEFFIEWIEK